jgi:cytochrome c oxidase cbb3-type subunit 3
VQYHHAPVSEQPPFDFAQGVLSASRGTNNDAIEVRMQAVRWHIAVLVALLVVARLGAEYDQGRGQTPARPPSGFPAQQRSPADPQMLDRGRQVYGIHCRSCHGVDLRGGDMGGPNLLRSDVMLNDQNGELLQPVVRGSRANGGMAAIDIPQDDVTAVAVYIHSVLATARGQGAPPPGPSIQLSILVGDAAAGAAYFNAKCTSCHSATGDLAGIGRRELDPTRLQNLWVAGGRNIRRDPTGPPRRRDVTAAVTLPSGQKVEGRLERIDDFNVTLIFEDASRRTFRRVGDVPKVDINDPLEGHKALLQVYTDRDIHDVTAYLVTLK